jgi:hypothetical protein
MMIVVNVYDVIIVIITINTVIIVTYTSKYSYNCYYHKILDQ